MRNDITELEDLWSAVIVEAAYEPNRILYATQMLSSSDPDANFRVETVKLVWYGAFYITALR